MDWETKAKLGNRMGKALMAEHTLEKIKEQLKECSDVVYQVLQIHEHTCQLIYIPSIVDMACLQECIGTPLHNESSTERNWSEFIERLDQGSAFPIPYLKVYNIKKAIDLVVEGKVILFINELPYQYYFEITKYQKRSISESQNELVVVGPQEAFIEDIQSNLSLLRHKIKHPDLKTKHFQIGQYTKTDIYVVYIEGLYKKENLDEIEKGLKNVEVDSIFGASSLSEQLKQDNLGLFPIFKYTERPDSVAAALLEGRIGILQDGSPSAMVTPVTFFSLLHSSEDYYQDFYVSSWIRMVRFLFSFISLLLPSLYVAITTFHSEIIPSNLLITIAAARENIPFSALTEALIMELTFDALREAGTRIPKPVGQTVSVIGGIVIGQAAVQAGIFSAPMIIVVSITGIASFIIPHLELGLAFRLLRFPLLLVGGTMGLIGIFAATFILYGHLANLKSFGIPYLQPLAPIVIQDWKDTLLRAPLPIMKKQSSSKKDLNSRR